MRPGKRRRTEEEITAASHELSHPPKPPQKQCLNFHTVQDWGVGVCDVAGIGGCGNDQRAKNCSAAAPAELRDTDGGARKEETRGEERIVRNERENREDGEEMFEWREEEVYIV
ncbi:hypothetical protein GX48_06313 [Paracoccidioides brasiliensis]|nr:hypothetical protein GX48_06313 [Paracoccidioides brasiliensis]